MADFAGAGKKAGHASQISQRGQAGVQRRAAGPKGGGQSIFAGAGPTVPLVQRYPYINSSPPDTDEAQIYGIFKATNMKKPIYVGQTTWARAGDRWVEHTDDDNWAPWHKDNVGGYNWSDESTWPYVPRTLEHLVDVTKFEVTAAEQWWWEQKGARNLWNRQQPMTNATFHKYKSIPNNYDNKKIQVGKTWEPTDQ